MLRILPQFLRSLYDHYHLENQEKYLSVLVPEIEKVWLEMQLSSSEMLKMNKYFKIKKSQTLS